MNTPFPQREGIALEYKEAADSLPKNFFETVCAFLNRDGGLIVLGVADDGTITDINPSAVGHTRADIANLSNNPQKLDPPYLLFPHEETVDGKLIIRVQVPCSSQVRRSGGFIRKDPLSAETGYTLAAALMFGTDATIGQVAPANFTPFPKNPVICNFMLHIGRYEQAGGHGPIGLKDQKHFREHYQQRAIKAGVIELTIPANSTSRLQKYRLTALGRTIAQTHRQP